MYRRFIATITAASIAITALGAVPAFAGDRENARALAAILGLAVVGKIIHDNNKKDEIRRERGATFYTHKNTNRVHKPKAHKHQPPRYEQRHVQPRPLPQRVNRKLLPGQCLRSFETRRGKVRMFGRRCLNNNFQYARRLPQQCLYVFDTRRGDRQGYEARCMRKNGYRLAHG